MKKFIKNNYSFLIFVLIGGLIGGYCVGLYMYDSLSEELLKELIEQNITKEMYGIIAMIQYGILYGLFLAIIGILISQKVHLWQDLKYHKEALLVTIFITIISALLLFPGDKLIFGSLNEWVNNLYIKEPTIPKIISGLLVGGIIEEIMMRLFLMSLFALIIKKLFYKKVQEIPNKVYIIANILAAFLFALGHIPSTMTMTTITPVILIRCFLLNGGLGFLFGYLYQKYGIFYAMIAHGLCHLLADILALIFI